MTIDTQGDAMSDQRDHATYRQWLADAVAGELTGERREELQRHSLECLECREELAGLELVQTILRARPAFVVTDEMVQESRMELRARIRLERTKDARRGIFGRLGDAFSAPLPRFALVGAMALALGLGAGYALFNTPAQETVLPLQSALLSPDAAQGGSQITAVRFVDADATDGEVELAFQAVRPMRMKGSPDDPAIQKLLAYALATEPNAGVRIRTVNTLAGNSHPEIDAEIRTALVNVVRFDRNPGVRKQALQALAKFPMDDDIKRALLFVLVNDPNEGLRIDAINALLPAEAVQPREDPDLLDVLRTRMQYENNNYIRLRTRTALQEVQP